MYLANLSLRNFRQFGDGDSQLDISFDRGVTALVGGNDCGKSAIIDAIRYTLLTHDQHYIRVQPEDFHIDAKGKQADEISIRCELKDLNDDEKGAFAEYLTYDGADVSLIINWVARRRSHSPSARRWVDVYVRSGVEGTGPVFESSVRELLSSAYLRPLRDAAREMSSGRGSRLSQILENVPEISKGATFDENALPANPDVVGGLSLLGLADYFSHGVKNHKGVGRSEEAINSQYLSSLFLRGDSLRGRIDLTEGGSDAIRLRQILERLELDLLETSTGTARGHYGLGSNNILYMACELLLLGREPEGLPLLLIEEPEAHLHPQRQLRLMDFLTRAAAGKVKGAPRPVQIILTTHSPNLASTIQLENLVIMEGGRAYPLAHGKTRLATSDYKFLERFLDVTKANLFFARGVIVVEGDAEALLIPTLAQLLGTDLTEHGISVVNVGGTGLRRFSKIFQRADDKETAMSVRVACMADMDVMPDCAPAILGLVKEDDDEKWNSSKRRWKAERDFGDNETSREEALDKWRTRLRDTDGQSVRTFVADYWTLEYDLAFCGLAEEIYVAASLAKNDGAINEGKKISSNVQTTARAEFQEMAESAGDDKAALCSQIYKLFHSSGSSKAITAQYLANALSKVAETDDFDRAAFASKLPRYIVEAIAYVNGTEDPTAPLVGASPVEDADG